MRSARIFAMLVPTPVPSGHGFPESSLLTGSSCVMPVTVIVTGSPSGSVTPPTDMSANTWFGGHSWGCGGTGSGNAPVQSGGWLPGSPGRVVVVVDDVVVVVGGRVLVVVLLEVVVVGGRVVVVVGGRVVVVVDVVDVVVVGGGGVVVVVDVVVVVVVGGVVVVVVLDVVVVVGA